jgi:hypothetical protein
MAAMLKSGLPTNRQPAARSRLQTPGTDPWLKLDDKSRRTEYPAGKETITMKKIMTVLGVVGAAAWLALATGCASTKQTEDLLSNAGFKKIPATTPAQQTHLQSLPNHKISQAQRDGKTYFIYPDASHNVLYVGQAAQYQRYQQLREKSELTEEETNQQMLKRDNDWSPWGPWPADYMP